VSARVREIGIRMALGARRADVVVMIAKRSLSLSAVGVGAGTVLAYISGRWLQSLLVGVSPADGMTFAVAAALAATMATAGSLRPALRAARVDPVTVIRRVGSGSPPAAFPYVGRFPNLGLLHVFAGR